MRFLHLIRATWLSAAVIGALAQEQRSETPHARPLPEEFLTARGEAFWLAESAERALETGLPEVAFSIATQAMDAPETKPLARAALLRVAIDASLWMGEQNRAVGLVEEARGLISPDALAVRSACVAFLRDEPKEADKVLDSLKVDTLAPRDRVWYTALRGWIEMGKGQFSRGRDSFAKAEELAAKLSPGLAARVAYLGFRFSIRYAKEGASLDLAALQKAREKARGTEIGFRYAQQLAVALDSAGRKEESTSVILNSLATLPEEYEAMRDQFRLLLVVITGLDSIEGRNAARLAILGGNSVSLMRVALQHVVSVSLRDSSVPNEFLENLLDQLINPRESHPLADEALYYRSVARLFSGEYEKADGDAERLESQFPNSAFTRGALAVRASSAWRRSRYRTAASFLSRIRSEFGPTSDPVELSAFIADCFFRAGEQASASEAFQNAAEAYEIALSEAQDETLAGELLFQLVRSHLRAGDDALALDSVDNEIWRSISTSDMIWRSEWEVVVELRKLGRAQFGYERLRELVTRVEGDDELRLRLLWLACKLSIEAGQAEDTAVWVERLSSFVSGLDKRRYEPELLASVTASAALALATSQFDLGHPAEAIATLEELRSRFEGIEPALFSYIVQARYYSSPSQNRTVEAQQLLINLADSYPESRLAPMALYEAALNAEKRGQDSFLTQANALLQRIAEDYPDSEMVYLARLKQADLSRKLNKFGAARQIYEFLENKYKSRPDIYLAEISLSNTLLAQAAEDPTKFEALVSRLERLVDLPDAPLELRVEAGYLLGIAWLSQGDDDKAKRVFWGIYDMFFDTTDRVRLLGSKGKYWLSRTILEMAEIYEDDRQLDTARKFYQAIVSANLWGVELAKAQLARENFSAIP